MIKMIAIGLVVVALLGGGGWYWQDSRDKDDTNSMNQNSQQNNEQDNSSTDEQTEATDNSTKAEDDGNLTTYKLLDDSVSFEIDAEKWIVDTKTDIDQANQPTCGESVTSQAACLGMARIRLRDDASSTVSFSLLLGIFDKPETSIDSDTWYTEYIFDGRDGNLTSKKTSIINNLDSTRYESDYSQSERKEYRLSYAYVYERYGIVFKTTLLGGDYSREENETDYTVYKEDFDKIANSLRITN